MPRTELRTADGHTLDAFRIDPEGTPRAGLVVVQEIFGVNAHIRAVTARFAAAGYSAIAPALFDRVERGVQLGYDEAGFARGRALVGRLTSQGLSADLRAAVEAVGTGGRAVGMVGFCYGGFVVWTAAAELEGLRCGVSYYGSRIKGRPDLVPRCPVMMHVGRRDDSFPVDEARAIAAARENVVLHEYDVGHGFNCDHRGDFDADAAALAMERSLAFLGEHLG